MNSEVFGNYLPLNTRIHKIDARIKFLFLIIAITMIFLPYGNETNTSYPYAFSLIILSGLMILFGIIIVLSKIRLITILKSLKGILILLFVISILNMFFYKNKDEGASPLFSIGSTNIYPSSFLWTGYLIARILLTLEITLIFTSTTKPMDISYAIEWYLKPPTLFKIPVTYLSMIMSLTLRFIPLLLTKSRKIQNAQASRGLDSKNGNIVIKFKSLFSLVIPLVIFSVYESIYVAQALDIRGYKPKEKRTRYKSNKFYKTDFIYLFILLLIFSGLLFLSIYKVNGLRIDLFLK